MAVLKKVVVFYISFMIILKLIKKSTTDLTSDYVFILCYCRGSCSSSIARWPVVVILKEFTLYTRSHQSCQHSQFRSEIHDFSDIGF